MYVRFAAHAAHRRDTCVIAVDTSNEDLDYFIHYTVDVSMHADEFTRLSHEELRRLRQLLNARRHSSRPNSSARAAFDAEMQDGAEVQIRGTGRFGRGAIPC